MKGRRALIVLLCTTMLSGCSYELKLEKPTTASTNVDSYVNAVKAEKYNITGDVTLEKGDYVVYPDAGQSCTIATKEIGQEFKTRDFIHVEDETKVTIAGGYLLPLDKAPALNGEIVREGVYLVGFDTLPEKNKVGTDGMVVVCETIPTLFNKPVKTSYAKFDEFEAKDGMVVKLRDTYLVSRQAWDVQARTSAFWGSYVNTAIDATFGDNTALDTAKANYLILYGVALEARVLDGTIVKLESEDDVSFVYENKRYTLPERSSYTIVSNPDDIKPTGTTDKSTQPYREFVKDGYDDLGITDGDCSLFYIVGDYYTTDTLKALESGDKFSIRYINPEETDPQPITTNKAKDIKDGDAILQPSDNTLQELSEDVISMYDAMNAKLSEDNKVVVAKSNNVPEDTKPGWYHIASGKLNNQNFEYTVDENKARLITAGEYVLIYPGCPTYTALEDTTLVGVTIDEVLKYHESLSTGEKTLVDSTSTNKAETHQKSYNIKANEEYIIGTTMSSNTYTFNDYVDVTVRLGFTGRTYNYPKCKQVILQSGDSFTVTQDTVMTAQVTEEMDMAEKDAEAASKGLTPKTYTVKKSFVAGVDLPALDYTVQSDVEVKVGDATYTQGSTFTPAVGDKVTVSAECDFRVLEPASNIVTENRIDVFGNNKVPNGKYKVIGGSFSIGDTEYNVGDEVEIVDNEINNPGWFALEGVETPSSEVET